MKKTLIALMALAGVACGATEPAPYTGAALSAWLDDAAETVTNNQKYVLTFTLGDYDFGGQSSNVLFKLTNDFAIRQQVGRYIGLGSMSAAPVGSYASRSATGDSSIDLDTTMATVSVDTETAVKYSGWIYDAGTNNTGINGLTFSIDSSSANGTIITMTNGTRTITLQKDGHTGITNLDFSHADMIVTSASVVWGDNSNVITYTAPVTPSIPEPATATLSLLALCGLCARRRRA
ncbi:MAG: PEP-CTERM sorting domain-containing protein [Akkermansia sp.]|nr:PEP-CTERM sorting domain-containing protein [Akkermansia sp.]